MENVRTYTDEQGNTFTCEVLDTFKVVELNKDFMAYTMNDDGVSSSVTVRFVELINAESERPTIKPVDDADVAKVQETYKAILNEE